METSCEGLANPQSGWFERAGCRGEDVNLFFQAPGEIPFEAIACCSRCTVRRECLDYALDNHIEHGVFGGLTARQRRLGLQKHIPIRPTGEGRALAEQVLQLHRAGMTWRQINSQTGIPYRQVARMLSRYPR